MRIRPHILEVRVQLLLMPPGQEVNDVIATAQRLHASANIKNQIARLDVHGHLLECSVLDLHRPLVTLYSSRSGRPGCWRASATRTCQRRSTSRPGRPTSTCYARD